MVTGRIFFYSFLLIALGYGLNCVSADVNFIKIAANGDAFLELGRLVRAKTDEEGYTANLRGPQLIGNHSHEFLEVPLISSYLRITPISEDSFTVEVGAHAVNHIFRFEPKGFFSRHDDILLRFNNKNPAETLYIFESRAGVGITLMETLKRRNDLIAMPNQLSIEFEGSDGMNQLKAKLLEMLPYTNELGTVNGSIESRPHAALGGLSGELSKGACFYTLLERQIGSIFTASPMPLEFLAKSCHFGPESIAFRYQKIDPSAYSHIPKLEELAKKYTVMVFEFQNNEKQIGCRIQVYPNERGEYSMVITFDKTWLHAESLGTSSEEALVNASAKFADFP